MNHFDVFVLYKQRRKIEKSSRHDNCDVDVHRASLAKHLRKYKAFEKCKTRGNDNI